MSDSIYRAIVESFGEGAVVVDVRGLIVLANPAIERLFGYSAAELLGQHVELLLPEERRAVHVLQRQVFAEAPSARPMGSTLALFGRHKDGSLIPLDISLTPASLDGTPVTIATVRDLSPLRSAREALRRALAGRPDGSDEAGST
jgi:PAS domain S-box-containing protein